MSGAHQCLLFGVERCPLLGGSKCMLYGKINQGQVIYSLYRGCPLFGESVINNSFTVDTVPFV